MFQKHHFRELSEEAQQSFGSTPESFVNYWISRFPLLLLHSWTAMQYVRKEPIFLQYYSKEYTFPIAVEDGQLPPWLLERQELDNNTTDVKHEEFNKSKQSSPKHNSSKRRSNDEKISTKEVIRSSFKRKRPQNVEMSADDAERENWLKSGREHGAWRPNRFMQKKEKKKTEENIVWVLPPS